jgi:hypothetical protein
MKDLEKGDFLKIISTELPLSWYQHTLICLLVTRCLHYSSDIPEKSSVHSGTWSIPVACPVKSFPSVSVCSGELSPRMFTSTVPTVWSIFLSLFLVSLCLGIYVRGLILISFSFNPTRASSSTDQSKYKCAVSLCSYIRNECCSKHVRTTACHDWVYRDIRQYMKAISGLLPASRPRLLHPKFLYTLHNHIRCLVFEKALSTVWITQSVSVCSPFFAHFLFLFLNQLINHRNLGSLKRPNCNERR